MTETFATTVVTVAPILWLLAAVEVQQSAKRMNEEDLAGSVAMLMQVKAELAVADDETVASHEWSTDQKDRWLSASPWILPLFTAWGAITTITTCLLVATFYALSWLAGVEDRPDGDEAAFCYYTLLISFTAVTIIPVAVSVIRGIRQGKRMGELRDEIDALRASAARRLSNREEPGSPSS
jgi:hypothetical protein